MPELSSETWRRAFSGDHAAAPAQVPWSRNAGSRPGSRGVSFDNYSSLEYRLDAVERGVAGSQTGLRSVADEVAGTRTEMRDIGRRVARLPGRGFLLLLLVILLLAGAVLTAFAPMIQDAVAQFISPAGA